jgi:hypothetical protein
MYIYIYIEVYLPYMDGMDMDYGRVPSNPCDNQP